MTIINKVAFTYVISNIKGSGSNYMGITSPHCVFDLDFVMAHVRATLGISPT